MQYGSTDIEVGHVNDRHGVRLFVTGSLLVHEALAVNRGLQSSLAFHITTFGTEPVMIEQTRLLKWRSVSSGASSPLVKD